MYAMNSHVNHNVSNGGGNNCNTKLNQPVLNTVPTPYNVFHQHHPEAGFLHLMNQPNKQFDVTLDHICSNNSNAFMSNTSSNHSFLYDSVSNVTPSYFNGVFSPYGLNQSSHQPSHRNCNLPLNFHLLPLNNVTSTTVPNNPFINSSQLSSLLPLYSSLFELPFENSFQSLSLSPSPPLMEPFGYMAPSSASCFYNIPFRHLVLKDHLKKQNQQLHTFSNFLFQLNSALEELQSEVNFLTLRRKLINLVNEENLIKLKNDNDKLKTLIQGLFEEINLFERFKPISCLDNKILDEIRPHIVDNNAEQNNRKSSHYAENKFANIVKDDNNNDEDGWNCGACTYFNHHTIAICEMCEMPKILF